MLFQNGIFAQGKMYDGILNVCWYCQCGIRASPVIPAKGGIQGFQQIQVSEVQGFGFPLSRE